MKFRLVFMTALLLTACGQKGGLFIPEGKGETLSPPHPSASLHSQKTEETGNNAKKNKR